MRHKKSNRKFSRTPAHRKMMFRNLLTSIIESENGSLKITVAKAKDLRRVVDKYVNIAKVDSLHNRKKAYKYVLKQSAVKKLFTEIGPKYKDRNGGYCRVIKAGQRASDAAPMAYISLVEEELKTKSKKKTSKAKAAPKKKADAKVETKPKKSEPKKSQDSEPTDEANVSGDDESNS